MICLICEDTFVFALRLLCYLAGIWDIIIGSSILFYDILWKERA